MQDFAIVTGGARGIGAAVAQRLKADGLRVAVVDRVRPEHDVADEVLVLDLSDVEAVQSALGAFCKGRRVTRLSTMRASSSPPTWNRPIPIRSTGSLRSICVRRFCACRRRCPR